MFDFVTIMLEPILTGDVIESSEHARPPRMATRIFHFFYVTTFQMIRELQSVLKKV